MKLIVKCDHCDTEAEIVRAHGTLPQAWVKAEESTDGTVFHYAFCSHACLQAFTGWWPHGLYSRSCEGGSHTRCTGNINRDKNNGDCGCYCHKPAAVRGDGEQK